VVRVRNDNNNNNNNIIGSTRDRITHTRWLRRIIIIIIINIIYASKRVRVWCTYVQYIYTYILRTWCPHASPPSFLSTRTQSRNYRRRRRRRYYIHTKKKTRSKNTRL